MTNAQRLAKLRRLARRWGGDIVYTFMPDNGITSVAPFNDEYGVDWRARRVYIHPELTADEVSIPAVIHEMGHVFASSREPYNAIEPEWFGWEYLVARWVGGIMSAWHEFHADYGLGDLYNSYDFGMLDPGQVRVALDNAIAVGQKRRNITADRRPRSVRRGKNGTALP